MYVPTVQVWDLPGWVVGWLVGWLSRCTIGTAIGETERCSSLPGDCCPLNVLWTGPVGLWDWGLQRAYSHHPGYPALR
jgi:hypothetical protein